MRMRSTCFALIVLLALSAAAASAAGPEKQLRSRWLGAWVVTTTEAYSDCSGMYTNNRVNGNFVSSKGAHPFPTGEIAKVRKVNLNKSRLDIQVTLAEPLLVAYQDGPFTLFRETHCRVEFEVMVPRQAVKDKDIGRIDAIIAQVIHRFPTEAQAKRSNRWNRRQRDDYPPDYQQTLFEHALWKVDTHNALVQDRLDAALHQTVRIADRVDSDPQYLQGFAAGVETARAIVWSNNCGRLLGVSLASVAKKTHTSHAAVRVESDYDLGLADGATLVKGLELMQRLPGCFLEPPDPAGFNLDYE